MAGLVKTLAAPRYGSKPSAGGGGGSQIARALSAAAPAATPQRFYTPMSASAQQPDALARTLANGQNTFTSPGASQPATQPPPAPPTAPGPPAPPAGGGNPSDWSGDPIYQQILAATSRGGQDAQSGALAQRKQELIPFGYDPSLDTTGAGRQLFPDQATLEAAQGNPFSTLAGLRRGYEHNLNEIPDQLNRPNLLYSSHRPDQEALAGMDFQQALAEAEAGRNSRLSAIDSALAAALQQGDEQRILGAQSAYDRVLAHPTDVAPPVTVPPMPPDQPPGPPPVDRSGGALTAPDYLTALALARATRRAIAV